MLREGDYEQAKVEVDLYQKTHKKDEVAKDLVSNSNMYISFIYLFYLSMNLGLALFLFFYFEIKDLTGVRSKIT